METKVADQKSQITHFRYDALNRRVARHENATNKATLFVLDRWNVILEYSPSQRHALLQALRLTWSQDISRTMQGFGGIGGILSTKQSSSAELRPTEQTVNFFHADSNGNIIRVSSIQGNESASYSYDTFGKLLSADGSVAVTNQYQFSTKPVEVASGLLYYGFRFYSLNMGRWISNDPHGIRGGVNLLAFVHNRATQLVDILGREPGDGSTGNPTNDPPNTNLNCLGYAVGSDGWQPPNPGMFSLPGIPVVSPALQWAQSHPVEYTQQSLGGTNTSCDGLDPCPCGQHRIVIFEDPTDSSHWHVYRDDYSSYSCKYGQGGVFDDIADPLEDYYSEYQPGGEPTQTCLCVPSY